MKIIKGDLIMTEDMTFDEDLRVEGNIFGKDGNRYNLNCRNLYCRDLDCWNLNCGNLDCRDLNCWDLSCWNLNCRDLDFYAIAIAYLSFKCKSWKAQRDNFVIKCLDGKIEIKEKKICKEFGRNL